MQALQIEKRLKNGSRCIQLQQIRQRRTARSRLLLLPNLVPRWQLVINTRQHCRNRCKASIIYSWGKPSAIQGIILLIVGQLIRCYHRWQLIEKGLSTLRSILLDKIRTLRLRYQVQTPKILIASWKSGITRSIVRLIRGAWPTRNKKL